MYHDIDRQKAANKPLLKTVFQLKYADAASFEYSFRMFYNLLYFDKVMMRF